MSILNDFHKHADKTKPLTDKGMKENMPIFVDEISPDHHNCGTCAMRIEPEGCTIIKGKINMDRGTCTFWAKGPASTEKDTKPSQMDYATGGYVEAPEGMKINCGTCKHFETPDMCLLWSGTVKPKQCCMAYQNDQVKQPKND